MFRPRLWTCLRSGYSLGDFLGDLNAGVIVGIVALPLAMAFAIASGASPQAGLTTVVIAGVAVSLFGGSRVQIGGPTGAFVVIVYGVIEHYGYEGLLISCLMAGVILVLMGAFRMGALIKFIPYPVTMGFTNGIAALIMLSQVKDFLGLRIPSLPSEFFEKVATLIDGIGTANVETAGLALGCFALVRFWPKRWARFCPGTLVAVVASALVVRYAGLSVETIGSRFGELPRGLSEFAIPELNWSQLSNYIMPATTIALLAAIESLLSAVVADGMIDDRHDSNQELVGQGIANILSPLFGGLPATGAIARTATNVKTGARTPLAGIFHALFVLAALLVAAPLAKGIPMACLAAILVSVAWNMGEWREFAMLRRYPRSDALVFMTTFLLTVVVDLTVAVEVGMVLAAALFIKRVSETTDVGLVSEATETEGDRHSIIGKEIPDGVLVYRVIGPLFFGAADKLERTLIRSNNLPKVLILRVRKVGSIDSTALTALTSLHRKLKAHGSTLLLSSPQPQPLASMRASGLIEEMGESSICPDVTTALDRARSILNK